jgi:hypothetical protein
VFFDGEIFTFVLTFSGKMQFCTIEDEAMCGVLGVFGG